MKRRGFTLLEIMFSIMILGVGLIAVASMFPVAAAVQQNTIDDMMAQEVGANAKAMLRSRGISKDAVTKSMAQVWMHPSAAVAVDLVNYSHLAEYSYPTSIPQVKDRIHFWQALAMKKGTTTRVFVVVMKRRGAVPPQLVFRGASAGSMTKPYTIRLNSPADHLMFDVGSTVVDDLGGIYQVIGVDRAGGVLTTNGRPNAGIGSVWAGNQDTRGRGSTMRVFAVGGVPLRN